MLELVKPALNHLASYKAALEKGWSPDNLRPEAAHEELAKIAQNAQDFIDQCEYKEISSGLVTLPDGSKVPRLPGFKRWIWDGEFCGSLGFRWQKGTTALPSHVLGHIGYATVPWKRGQGYTKRALALLLEEIRPLGLSHVDLTTEPDNIASQRVMLANEAVLVERFIKDKAYGSHEALRYRIHLAP